MTDISTLGIKIDTTDLKGAKTALDQFAAAAKPAADAAHGVESAHAGLSTQGMAAAKA